VLQEIKQIIVSIIFKKRQDCPQIVSWHRPEIKSPLINQCLFFSAFYKILDQLFLGSAIVHTVITD
jgi:hypothetical protein